VLENHAAKTLLYYPWFQTSLPTLVESIPTDDKMVHIVIGVPPDIKPEELSFCSTSQNQHEKLTEKSSKSMANIGKPDPLEEQHGYDGMPPKRCDVNQTINSSTTIRPLFVIEFQFHSILILHDTS